MKARQPLHAPPLQRGTVARTSSTRLTGAALADSLFDAAAQGAAARERLDARLAGTARSSGALTLSANMVAERARKAGEAARRRSRVDLGQQAPGVPCEVPFRRAPPPVAPAVFFSGARTYSGHQAPGPRGEPRQARVRRVAASGT
jgi:hypothetical protein